MTHLCNTLIDNAISSKSEEVAMSGLNAFARRYYLMYLFKFYVGELVQGVCPGMKKIINSGLLVSD